jgi:aspartyl-tRNA synthetase
VRQEVARGSELVDPTAEAFVWVVDFPMFAGSRRRGRSSRCTTRSRRPSRRPRRCSTEATEPRVDARRPTTSCYNGTELGGGSIRIATRRVQGVCSRCWAFDEATAERKRFGFLLEGCGRARRRTAASPSASTASP